MHPPGLPWLIGLAGCSLLLGLLVVTIPLLAVSLVVLALLLALAWARPEATMVGCLCAASLHAGLFLYLRGGAGSLPVSAFDIVPILLLGSAISIRSRVPDAERAGIAPLPAGILALFIAGFVLGPIVGLSAGADSYELLRIVRIEFGLLCALAAAFVGGPLPDWRSAFVRGLLIAGVITALEFVLTYLWYEVGGRSFWAMFPFGSVEDPEAQIQRGDVSAVKTVYISIYLLFPALCIGAAGIGRWSRPLLALVLAAAVLSLIRGAWIGAMITLATVFVATLWARDLRLTRLMKAGFIALPIIAVVSVVAGTLIQNRLDTSLNTDDVSYDFRLSESKAAIRALTSDPSSFVFGEGSGVAIPRRGIPVLNARGKATSLLENNVLSRWSNLTLFSLIGSAMLFFGGALCGFRSLRAGGGAKPDVSLSVMSLCLPAVWIGGLFGGSLMYLQVSLPFWLLGGTVLAWLRSTPGRTLSDTG